MIRFSPSKAQAPVRPRIFVGDMTPKYRTRVRDILTATKVFRDEEVDVAIELFDEVYGSPIGVDRVSNYTPANSDYFFLGAFTPEEELAGFACYGPTPGTDRTYDLYWIAVHPSAQGTGSGTILLNEVERRLKGQNARLLVVETSSRSDYKNTRGFYVRRGYVESARACDFYAPADDRITFTKRLQSRAPFSWAHGVESQ
jgi:ribosomal protein S18 acetylase RimI-like enzyme